MRQKGEKEVHLEETARLVNRAFTTCMTDRYPPHNASQKVVETRSSDAEFRAPLESSRKWGTFFFAGMLTKTYFRLNKPSLHANVQRAVNISDLPPLSDFPRSHIVTWKYYCGVFAFIREDYETVPLPPTMKEKT